MGPWEARTRPRPSGDEVRVKDMYGAAPCIQRKDRETSIVTDGSLVGGRWSLANPRTTNDQRPTTNDPLPPLLAHRAKLQLNLLTGTFLHFQRRAICFLGFQKVGVAPDAVFHVLPGIEPVAARSQAANREASVLVGRSGHEAIGKLAILFLRHGDHRGVGDRMISVHILFLFHDHSFDRASLV